MKKLVVTIFLLISLGANILFANPVSDFINSVASGIFSTAWPTATYKSIEILENKQISSGYETVVKFKGNSSGKLCMVGDCPLWFTLDIHMDSEHSISSIRVLEHNAILAPPFQTSGAIAQAIIYANNR